MGASDRAVPAGFWQRGGVFFALGIVSTALAYLIVTAAVDPLPEPTSPAAPVVETTDSEPSPPKAEAMTPAELERYRRWAESVNARNRTFGSAPTSPAPGVPAGQGAPGAPGVPGVPRFGPTVPSPGLGNGGPGP